MWQFPLYVELTQSCLKYFEVNHSLNINTQQITLIKNEKCIKLAFLLKNTTSPPKGHDMLEYCKFSSNDNSSSLLELHVKQ